MYSSSVGSKYLSFNILKYHIKLESLTKLDKNANKNNYFYFNSIQVDFFIDLLLKCWTQFLSFNGILTFVGYLILKQTL